MDDEVGLKLQEEAFGLCWYDEHGLADADPNPPIVSILSASLQPYIN